MNSTHPTVAILTHSEDRFAKFPYFVRLLIPRWEAMGFRAVVLTEKSAFVPADIALLHVAFSTMPDSCRRLAERYPIVLNRRVLDIRKRRYSQLLLGREEPWSGPVIIKTDWNCRGWKDLRLGLVESPVAPLLRLFGIQGSVNRARERFEMRRSWRRRRLLPDNKYLIYEHRDMVPDGVWDNPSLVVERYVAEREGSLYCCRHWVFFGAQEVSRRSLSPNPVVKVTGKLEALSDPVPAELRAIREKMGFDYGKFDYGLVDGRVFLYDANRTPGHATDIHRHDETVEVLSHGIRRILEGSAADVLSGP